MVTDPFYLKGMATSSSYFKWKENRVATSSLSLQDNADGMTTSAFYMEWKRNGMAVYPSHSPSP